MASSNISFYPVIQLLTGPPGLIRNGGVWKVVKKELHNVTKPANIMVQAMHMTNYSLSTKSWNEWMDVSRGVTRLKSEIDEVFGSDKSVFIDSGGFQLMYKDMIDLSRWNLKVSPEDILELQGKYSPDKIASLDYPLSTKATHDDFKKSMKLGIKNIEYLLDNYTNLQNSPIPYLVVHGRNDEELSIFLKKLKGVIDFKKANEFGIALGSQVPLTTNPNAIIDNIEYVLKWMNKNTTEDTPIHIFGIGEPIAGEVDKRCNINRPFSFDNSTSVQKGYKLRIYDPSHKCYRPYDPYSIDCECPACKSLRSIGAESIIDSLSKKSYNPDITSNITKSDVYGYITLHNIYYWKDRVDNLRPLRVVNKEKNNTNSIELPKERKDYEFPLRSFNNLSPNLILVACSKTRPYRNSQSHRRIINHLEKCGYNESIDFDRITLSGFYGPVFWGDETDSRIMNYDFQLNSWVGENHRNILRMRTAMVLNVIGKKYRKIVAYLPAKQYRETFAPILKEFNATLVNDCSKLADVIDG